MRINTKTRFNGGDESSSNVILSRNRIKRVYWGRKTIFI
jgi:hypothetical protein